MNSGEVSLATVITSPPSFTPFVSSTLTPSLREASGDQPITYSDGCHLGFSATQSDACVYGDGLAPRIVLFGDSHAAQWFPALLAYAEANGLALENHTKSSCPSISLDVLRNGVPYNECTQWRDSVIAGLNESPPEFVVIANYGFAQLEDDSSDYAAAWGLALSKTVTRINAPTVILADTPNLLYTPSVCLSANLIDANDCGQPLAVALASDAREAEENTAKTLGIPYIDLNEYLCSKAECAPIIGDTLVYRDSHHITATFSALLGESLGEAIASHSTLR